MHAFLIVGSTPENRRLEARELASRQGVPSPAGAAGAVYRFILDGEQGLSLTIDDVRELQRFIAQASSRPRAAMILEAQRLTRPAQHALLKTLEEPQPETDSSWGKMLIILTADSEPSLLPTIRSRCRISRLQRPAGRGTAAKRISKSVLLKLSRQTPAKRILALYEEFSKFTGRSISPHQGAIHRPEALEFVSELINELHQQINYRLSSGLTGRRETDYRSLARVLRQAVAAHRRLEQNLNPNLVLQQFVLDIEASN